MTTNLHDKMLAAIDALFSASDAVEEELAENLLLDVRDEILKQPAQQEPLTAKEIAEFVGTHEYGPEQLKWFRLGEAAHGITSGEATKKGNT